MFLTKYGSDSAGVVELGQLFQLILRGAGKGNLRAGIVDLERPERYRDQMPAETEKAADLQDGEQHPVFIGTDDDVIQGADLVVLSFWTLWPLSLLFDSLRRPP